MPAVMEFKQTIQTTTSMERNARQGNETTNAGYSMCNIYNYELQMSLLYMSTSNK